MEVERREKIEGRDGSRKVSEDRIRVTKTTHNTSGRASICRLWAVRATLLVGLIFKSLAYFIIILY